MQEQKRIKQICGKKAPTNTEKKIKCYVRAL